MEAIEFDAIVGRDGIIKVPKDFSVKINGGKAHVIILAKEKRFLTREEIYDV